MFVISLSAVLGLHYDYGSSMSIMMASVSDVADCTAATATGQVWLSLTMLKQHFVMSGVMQTSRSDSVGSVGVSMSELHDPALMMY